MATLTINGKSIEEIIQEENFIIANDNNKNNSNTNNNLITLNRNINETQIITKNKTEGGYNVDLNLSPHILYYAHQLDQKDKFLETGMKNLKGTAELYGNAVFGLGDGKQPVQMRLQELYLGLVGM